MTHIYVNNRVRGIPWGICGYETCIKIYLRKNVEYYVFPISS